MPVKSLKIVFLLTVCLSVFWAKAAAEVVERIVAVVNDEVISQSELEQMAKAIQSQPGMKMPSGSGKDLQRQLLDGIILQKLAKAEAKRRGITVTEKEVDKAMEEFKKRNNISDDETFTKMLAQNGMTLQGFKQQLTDQMIQERLLVVIAGGKVAVTESDVRQFYEKEYPKTGEGATLHLKMLNIPLPSDATETQKQDLKTKAEGILQQIRQGASLEKLSQEQGFQVQDLGFVAQGDMDPELAGFLSKVKVGDTAPIQTLEGFKLVQVVDRRDGGRGRSFEEAAPEIRAHLQRQQMEKTFEEWIKGQRERAHIKIMM